MKIKDLITKLSTYDQEIEAVLIDDIVNIEVTLINKTLKPNDKVLHNTFGEGIIVKIDRSVYVKFSGDKESKRFSPEMFNKFFKLVNYKEVISE